MNVSFTSSKDLSNADVWVVPELQPYVQVQPSSFAEITKGQTNNLSLTLSANQDAPLGTFDGTVHLRSRTRTIASPLPVVVSVGEKFTNEEVSFYYPTFGKASKVIVEEGDIPFFRVQLLSPSENIFITQFGFVIRDNPEYLSLNDWFYQNIDPTGILQSSNAYVQQRLTNDMVVLVRVGIIPYEYLQHSVLVDDIYAISPSGEKIVILSRSQVHELSLYGYDADAQDNLLLNILESMRFP